MALLVELKSGAIFESVVFILYFVASRCSQIVKKVLHRAPVHTDDNYFGWADQSCCMERQNCMGKRLDWRPVKDPNVTMVS